LKDPVVSIIIPTLNSGATLQFCLESLVSQTYDNIEILIIDGLSTDNTLDIANNYSSRFNNIKVFSEKDLGIYDAMNKGILFSNGTWLYFLGSDDKLLNINILKIVFIPENYFENDILYGNVVSTRFNGRYDFAFDCDKIFIKNICQQAIFFRKDVFDKTGNFNLRFKAHADWDHNMKWILNPNIKNKYLDIDIADYADGGFSSLTPDAIFEKEKTYKYLKYGIQIFHFKKSQELLNQLLNSAIKQRNYRRIFNLGTLAVLILVKRLKSI